MSDKIAYQLTVKGVIAGALVDARNKSMGPFDSADYVVCSLRDWMHQKSITGSPTDADYMAVLVFSELNHLKLGFTKEVLVQKTAAPEGLPTAEAE